jgi:hypothetical protein
MEAPCECRIVLDVRFVLIERRRGDHPNFTPRQDRLEDGRRIRGRTESGSGTDHRMGLIDEEHEIRMLFDLADHALYPVLEHAPQHRAGDHRIHLQIDDLALAESHRNGVRLEFDPSGEPFDDSRLADSWLADQHDGVGTIAVAKDLEDLLNLAIPAVHRRDFVLPCK